MGDVSKREVNEQMIDFAVEKFGKLDVLVNNAGMGQPIDAACAVLYLASDEAKFINGAYLTVDGGWGAS